MILLGSIAALLALIGAVVGVMAMNRISPLALGLHRSVFHVDGVALDGFDVTTYFSGSLARGDERFAETYGGVTFWFATEENKEAFSAEPTKFLPRFGGYCTKAVSTGFAAPADPEIYSVTNGELYIFSSEEVKNQFIEDPGSMIASCDARWNEQAK